MKSINKVTLLGYVGAVRDAGKGKSVSIATTKYWKSKDSDDFDSKTEWHNVYVGEKLIPKGGIGKGVPVYVEGSIQYTEKDGKYYTNIYADIFTTILKGEKDGQNAPRASKQGTSRAITEPVDFDDTPPEDDPFAEGVS